MKQERSPKELRANSERTKSEQREIRKFRLLTGAEQAIFADSGPENGQNANIC